MNNPSTDSQASETVAVKSNDSSQNRMIRRIGIVAAVFFLIASSLVFLFTSIAPNLLGADLQRQLKGHPVIEAELGELQSCEFSYSSTFANGNPNVIVFEVVGSKDKGQLIVEQISTSKPAFNLDTIIIRKYDGREIPLANASPKPAEAIVAP